MNLVLNNSGLSLELSVNETGWCTLDVAKNGLKHPIGADSIGVVQRCLRSALADSAAVEHHATIRGIGVRRVLNLFVHPWSIYVRTIHNGRHLLFRNRETGTTIETVMSKAACEHWRQALLDFDPRCVANQRLNSETPAKSAAE